MLHSPCWKAKQLHKVHCLCYGTSQSLIDLLPVNGKHKKAPAATSSSWLPISNSLSRVRRMVATCFSAAFCLAFPCFPRETALSHPLGCPRMLKPRLSVPNPCVCCPAACFASLSLSKSGSCPRRACVLLGEVNRGQMESACRDSGNEANGRSRE